MELSSVCTGDKYVCTGVLVRNGGYVYIYLCIT